jgi:hypothetical protein
LQAISIGAGDFLQASTLSIIACNYYPAFIILDVSYEYGLPVVYSTSQGLGQLHHQSFNVAVVNTNEVSS